MGRGASGYLGAVAVVAVSVCATLALAWTPVKHFGEDKFVYGVIRTIDHEARTMTVVEDAGTPIQVRFEEETVFIVRDEVTEQPDLQEGMTVTVRCVSVLGEESDKGEGLCPIVVVADRVVLEGPVAVSSEVNPSPNP